MQITSTMSTQCNSHNANKRRNGKNTNRGCDTCNGTVNPGRVQRGSRGWEGLELQAVHCDDADHRLELHLVGAAGVGVQVPVGRRCSPASVPPPTPTMSPYLCGCIHRWSTLEGVECPLPTSPPLRGGMQWGQPKKKNTKYI